VPGWSQYYLDYKFLKKIISSLTGKRPPAEAASLALGVRPGDLFNPSPSSPKQPPWRSPNAFDTFSAADPQILVNQNSDDKDPEISAYKAAFFFKLERELEKVNTCTPSTT
jgi:CDK inhibitor PHO81